MVTKVKAKDVRELAALARRLRLKRIRANGISLEFFGPRAPKGDAATSGIPENLEARMPSDDEMLYAATPFFETEEMRKARHEQEDERESE